MTILTTFILAWGTFFAPPHVSFDPFRPTPVYYGPPPAHWRATECAMDDHACLRDHDEAVIANASLTNDITLCWKAIVPMDCATAVRRLWHATSIISDQSTTPHERKRQ